MSNGANPIRATAAELSRTIAPNEGPKPIVRIRGLQHYYGSGDLKNQVLFDINLDVYPGEIVIMTGQSGSGKTTLLTLIGTLRTVQYGSLSVLGDELLQAPVETILKTRRNIGFIFQAHNLFDSLTAHQNVRMALELLGAEEGFMNDRATELLKQLGLGERVHYKPSALSGGQKQRVAIARGLANKPRLILADEPTAALDKEFKRHVVNLFRELADKEKCAILMVTHDNNVLDVADRIVAMEEGKIKTDMHVKETETICEFLQESEVFAGLPSETFAQIAEMMTVERFPKGATIIRQGDVGDRFYLIRQGEVEVVVAKDGKSQVVATLGDGRYFGEAALLMGAPRNATVVTTQSTTLYALGKEEFLQVVSAKPTFRERLRNAIFLRQ